ncbi:helix-turn-helix transcriptional regulator [Bradyrhizobium sp. CB82]|uniref:helix-turn-helix domain-containing protein n=1 Tax=Bradyrhizobium sp. CB82 TaxID=3039159 RepID=UPI0024B1F002|nr:helix-turn-helix transcriptional regulator [Bradyrhizobium sp. CB82]WFU42627.1 helix-turn-helix transcriptional regulator [Bradyrhizobium sp. CB82]
MAMQTATANPEGASKPMGRAKSTKTKVRSAGSADRSLGVMIRTRRKEVGLSQSELGERLGVSFQQIQKYEKGVNRVSVARLSEIATALECDISLFTGAAKGDVKITPAMEFAASKDGHDIIAAMMRVSNPELRRSVIALARTLAEQYPQ